MATITEMHQALEQAVEYISGVLDGHMDEVERSKVDRWAALLEHPWHGPTGQCPVCGHFGDDCTGSKPTAVELFREAVDLKLKAWDKLADVEKAMGGELEGVDDLVTEFATACDTAAGIDEDDIVASLAALPIDRYDSVPPE